VHAYTPGDWFAVPLRFGLFAPGRAAAVDAHGSIVGYFFARFFERIPSAGDVLALAPGDADIIGVCDQHGLRCGEWPRIAPPSDERHSPVSAHLTDERRWPVPIFRTIDAASGAIRWSTFDPADLAREIVFEDEPSEAGVRNWGLPMPALQPMPMSWEAVEFALWRRFRDFQNGMHRKYIADMQVSTASNPWLSALRAEPRARQ
jgi:hypothetical protein